MERYNVIIEKGKDGIYVGSIPTLPGCHSDGETIDELLINLKEAALLWKEVNGNYSKEKLDFIGIQSLEI